MSKPPVRTPPVEHYTSRTEFRCSVCKTELDAGDQPYEWNESLEYIALPRLIRVDCPVCQVEREFILEWEILLEEAVFYGDDQKVELARYLKMPDGRF